MESQKNHPTFDRLHKIDPWLRDYQAHNNPGSSVEGTPLTFFADELVDDVAVVSEEQRDAMGAWFNTRFPEHAAGHTSLMAMYTARIALKNINSKDANVGMIIYDSASRA